ncbi:MAG: hypothetical protein RLZ98_2060 [Pseudomonadota bacterium]|jgi:hypothetical protein
MKLSKTDFLIYRECPHNAWLKVHVPEIYHAEPLSAFDLALLETGNDVDVLARELFPGGAIIDRGDAATTARLIAERHLVLYQPVFETERYTTACDILQWNIATDVYDLYEVKASTDGDGKKSKNELYAHDLAFQAEVLRQQGVPIGRLFIVRLKGAYIRGTELDIDQLFAIEDFTDTVAGIQDAVALEMETAHAILERTAPLPAPCNCIYKGRNAHCTTFAHTNPNVPATSVHDITRIGMSKKKLAALIDAGILAIENVPGDFELSEAQANQVRAARSGRASVDDVAIAEFLDGLSYPLAFLDYETYPAAIPRYPGYGPFHHIPFQFSLDVIDAPGAPMQHHEFLHTEPSCPDEPLLEALRHAMPASGSIITWNKTFEKGVNDKLAARNPAASRFLADLNDRIVDLMDVFSSQAYVHPDFRGRTSIKAILPVLVPKLSYKALEIQEGATATTRWNEMVTGEITADETAKLRAGLLAYCALDTKAMVEIWRMLKRQSDGN